MNPADFLTEQIKAIPPSGIRKFFDLAAEMDDVLSLSIGEPDFSTPMSFCEAGIKSLREGKTAYSANMGMIELRQEISKYLENLTGNKYDAKSEILVTVGGSEAVDIAFRAIVENGDEVLIPEPAFVAYRPCVELTGGVAVPMPLSFEDGFKVTPEVVEKYVTPKTKAILLNFPGNPTGVVMEKDELEALAKVCIKHNLCVISDEIYAELVYGQKHYSISSFEGMRDRTIVISGVSKAFAMTGWRLGYLAAPKEMMTGIAKIHQFALMCAPTVSQYAAVEAFKNGADEVKKMCDEYNKRRQYIVKRLRGMGLEIFEPKGAFYAFPCIKSTGMTSGEFCEGLLNAEHVAVVPGTAFGECGEGFIRISYAASMDTIEKAMDKMEKFIKANKK